MKSPPHLDTGKVYDSRRSPSSSANLTPADRQRGGKRSAAVQTRGPGGRFNGKKPPSKPAEPSNEPSLDQRPGVPTNAG